MNQNIPEVVVEHTSAVVRARRINGKDFEVRVFQGISVGGQPESLVFSGPAASALCEALRIVLGKS